MQFEFSTASRIIFGSGSRRQVPLLSKGMGGHAMVITGGSSDRSSGLISELTGQDVQVTVFRITREPTTDIILEGTRRARSSGCDMVIGIGGGSVIDGGKAIAALMTNRGDIFDYLEVIGRARPLLESAAPYIAVPTTAGTGTEVTKNAVIISPEHRVKVSMRSDRMLPRVVVVDPDLSCSMPPHVTAYTGVDALTQLIESYVSVRANPLTDGLCREGIVRAGRSLRACYMNGKDLPAREDMALASLFSGLTLANAGLGAVHGFAAPLGGMFEAPHGLVCARLLPLVMATNIRALTERDPGSPAARRYDEIARLLSGDPRADASAGLAWVRDLCVFFDIPPLSSVGVSREDIPDITARARRASSMKGNPVELTDEELSDILEQAL